MYHVENDSIHTEYICQYTPNTYQYIPGMYQYIPSIRTEIHTKIHTNTERWYWYESVRIKFQYVHYTSLMKLRSVQYQDADNRISNPTDLAAKLPSNLIFIILDMVHKRWRAVSAKTALCKSKKLTCFIREV